MTQILTETGFKDFSHIQSMGKKKTILIVTSLDNLQCTPDHSLMLNSGDYLPAAFLEIGDILYGEIEILDIFESTEEEVFDIVNVVDTHSYISNGIISHNCTHVYVDEIAFIPNNIAEEFLTSVFPVLSSGNETKIFITSTPKGMNIFYKMWVDAEAGRNGFIAIRVVWTEHPERNQEWYDDQVKNLGPVKCAQEVDCVGPNTKITVRNKKTGVIEQLRIADVFTRINNSLEQPIKTQ